MARIIRVASAVYNFSGEVEKRPDYLKTLVIGKVISARPASMAETINSGYLRGPGIKLRSYGRWAETRGYNEQIGLTRGYVTVGDSIDSVAISTQLPHTSDQTVTIQSAEITRNSILYFAEAHIRETRPADVDTDWTVDYLPDTSEMLITYVDASTELVPIPDYDPEKRYLSVRYILLEQPEDGPFVPGDPVPLGSGEAFPDVSTWTVVDPAIGVPTDVPLTKTTTTTKVFSDGRPNVVTTSTVNTVGTYNKIDGKFTKYRYNGSAPGSKETTASDLTQYQTQDAEVVEDTDTATGPPVSEGGGVTSVTTVVTVTESLKLLRQYTIDEQVLILSSWGDTLLLNYGYETGNAVLDAQFAAPNSIGDFLPPIPFRIKNKPVDATNFPTFYPWAKRAFKKAMGQNEFDNTLDKINENESIDDIDYAYATFAVSLNVKEDACKRYIYEFFRVMLASMLDADYYTHWAEQAEAIYASNLAWAEWQTAQQDPESPLFGTPEPARAVPSTMPRQEIRVIASGAPVLNFDMGVSWSGIREVTGSGQGKPGAKQGEFWWGPVTTETYPEIVFDWNTQSYQVQDINVPKVTLFWQERNNFWRSMSIFNLKHNNYVYKGRSVETSAADALADADESDFIIPIHRGIFNEISLINATQVSTACCFLVFNCYIDKKKKWYQTGWFKVILVVVIIVVAVFSAGAGAGAGAGLLGTAEGVGLALGFTGLAAIVVGTVANYLAAYLLLNLIQMGAVALFGEKVGLIVGTIAGMIALNVGTSLANGQSAMAGFGDLMRADNIIKLTEAAGKGYAEYLRADALQMQAKTTDLIEEADEQSKQYQQMYADNIGYGQGIIDPLMFTEAAGQLGFTPESLDSFMSRTLMTGSEIAELSHSLLENFADITLSQSLPT